jgi:hypothetical protein
MPKEQKTRKASKKVKKGIFCAKRKNWKRERPNIKAIFGVGNEKEKGRRELGVFGPRGKTSFGLGEEGLKRAKVTVCVFLEGKCLIVTKFRHCLKFFPLLKTQKMQSIKINQNLITNN